ncbi:DUF2515 domain-containing protein [Paenibacillus spongiae]|uniref:DUF2515 domain-containing protein n=1 Tax=Paenibacillus spongiae TaxID=2909671 RepID=A0ABY5S1I7_9BACL|nr:DUF2515 domain-containing protein [Paenibacillus spongiae]UVI27726.1 DUF2515 domain-containing protein [Paenibacillus spongiae]
MGIEFLASLDWLKKSPFPALHRIKRELKRKMKFAHKLSLNLSELPEKDELLIRHIQDRTRQFNVNNITRTMAYEEYYRRHPEIEWAFLGHMVSRNGGWNMTDLRGEPHSRLLSAAEQNRFFQFLERGNWLIFQDAYPQFLLYEESLRREKSLFHLLPFFHVSAFMEVMWNHFWTSGDRYLLTIALVINEQSYLEKRMIQNQHYQDTILQTLEFKLHDWLSMNQILFPYYTLSEEGVPQTAATGLIGETLHRFGSLHERILLGKRLYALLFGHPDRLQGILSWAKDHPHTASRKDYWPHLFNDVNDSVPGAPYKKRLDDCQLKPGASRFYSPALQYAWSNVEHEEAVVGDWLEDWKVIAYLMGHEEHAGGGIEQAYCHTLDKIELAVMAKTAIL